MDRIRLFFGIGKDEEQYRVVLPTTKDKAEAAALASQVTSETKIPTVVIGKPGDFKIVTQEYLTLLQSRRNSGLTTFLRQVVPSSRTM
jgi:hypothetical protein